MPIAFTSTTTTTLTSTALTSTTTTALTVAPTYFTTVATTALAAATLTSSITPSFDASTTISFGAPTAISFGASTIALAFTVAITTDTSEHRRDIIYSGGYIDGSCTGCPNNTHEKVNDVFKLVIYALSKGTERRMTTKCVYQTIKPSQVWYTHLVTRLQWTQWSSLITMQTLYASCANNFVLQTA